MKTSYLKYAITVILLGVYFSFEPVFAQAPNPQVVEQVRAMLSSKGLNENDVKARLKSKGIDVDQMSQDELIANKSAIEQVINEMEAEQKGKQNQPSSIQPVQPATGNTTIIIDKPDEAPKTQGSQTPAAPSTSAAQPTEAEKQQKEFVATLPKSDIFGHKVFREGTLAMNGLSKDANPPDTYILGSGDKITILIFGKSQADLQYEINASGFIQPTQMPKIFLSGLSLKQAKELIANRFSNYYSFNKDQFALVLNTSRTVTINVFGEVEKQGSYTISALNTALNALAIAGGPTDNGSVRNIQIISGRSKKVIDIYAFAKNPTTQFEYYLQNNDIIYVPPAKKLVTIEGAVYRPMRYELKEGEGINELLEYAGGLRTDAFTDFVQVQTIADNKVVINDYVLKNLMAGSEKLKLNNGDILSIKSINNPLKSFVSIAGAVQYEGRYDIKTTSTIKALIAKASLKPEAKTDQVFIIRKQVDQSSSVISLSLENILAGSQPDMQLQPEDQLIIYDKARYTDQFIISVMGEVRDPFKRNFKYGSTITIGDAINLAGGTKASADKKAYIYRTDPFKPLNTTYITVDLNTNNNDTLYPGDNLVVLNSQIYNFESSITLTGDVRKFVQTRFDTSLTVKDLILMAGGLTISSDYSRVEIFRLQFKFSETPERQLIRLSVDKDFNLVDSSVGFQLQPFDIVVVRRIPDFGMQETVEIQGEVKHTGPYYIKRTPYYFSDLINDAGGLSRNADIYNITLIRYVDNSGLIVFDAMEALKHKRHLKKDPILFPGDYVNAPQLNNTVQIETSGTNYILGTNQKVLQVTYQGAISASKYVKNYAGGFARNADAKRLRVISTNGIVKTTKHFLFFKNYPKVHPGDKILVPLKPEAKKKEKGEEKPVDWDKFLTRMLAIATTLALIGAFAK